LIPYDSVDAIKVSEEAVLSTENVGLGKSPIFNLGQVDSSVLVTIILTLTVINYFFYSLLGGQNTQELQNFSFIKRLKAGLHLEQLRWNVPEC